MFCFHQKSKSRLLVYLDRMLIFVTRKFCSSLMKKYLSVIVKFVLSTVIGVLFAILVLKDGGLHMPFTEFMWKFSWLLICLFLSAIVHIAVHEGGHMVAALLRGWKFFSFMILGVVLSRRDGRFYLSRFSLPGAGGQCLMLPPEKGDTPAGLVLYNAGGVLANLLVVIVAVVLLCVWDTSMPFLWQGVLVPMVLVGLFFALTNGIPLTVGGIPNDGMNLLKLRKDAFASEAFLRTMRILGCLMQGDARRTDVFPYLCEGKEVDYANPLHVAALASDLSLAMIRMDFDKARAILQRIEPHKGEIASVYLCELSLEQIFLTLIVPHQEAEIDQLLTPSMRQYISQQAVFRPAALRVQYALALLHEHDQAKAEEIYGRFQEVCLHYYIPGDAQTDLCLVEYLRESFC